MFTAKRAEVVAYIKSLAIPSVDKEALLFGWARTVGARLRGNEFRAVAETGIDRSGPVGTPPTLPTSGGA